MLGLSVPAMWPRDTRACPGAATIENGPRSSLSRGPFVSSAPSTNAERVLRNGVLDELEGSGRHGCACVDP
jgi:hypothetical protein